MYIIDLDSRLTFSELFRIITYDWFSGFKVQVEILKSQLSSYLIQ